MVPINYLAVLACAVVAMALGFLWYGALFGKIWMKLEGMPVDALERAKNDPAAKKKMMQGYVIQFIAALVMAFVLAHAIIFAAAYPGLGIHGLSAGLITAFMSWIGFVAPPTLGMVLWEGKPWKLWILINAYWLILLLGMGGILALWM